MSLNAVIDEVKDVGKEIYQHTIFRTKTMFSKETFTHDLGDYGKTGISLGMAVAALTTYLCVKDCNSPFYFQGLAENAEALGHLVQGNLAIIFGGAYAGAIIETEIKMKKSLEQEIE